jgi:hypothetical protein
MKTMNNIQTETNKFMESLPLHQKSNWLFAAPLVKLVSFPISKYI